MEASMPLIEARKEKRLIPDDDGGWYWMKWGTGKWEPVIVEKAGGGWPPTILRNSHTIEVTDPSIQWGPQIFPPE